MFLVNRKRTAFTYILPTLFALLAFHSFAPVHADEDKKSRRSPPQSKYTAEGVEGCIRCHAGVRMTLMAKTVHGNKENPHTPYAVHGCESCHGPGSLHVSRARGGVGFPALLAFRQWESTELHNEACMRCHGKDMGELSGMTWKGSLHQTRGMTCVYCHQSHVASDKMKDQKLQKERCSKCHSSKIAAHKEVDEPLETTKCSACHDVHNLMPEK